MALPRSVLRGLVILLCVLAGAAAWFFIQGRGGQESSGVLTANFAVPEFSLIERSGARVSRADLLGKVWVTNFIYTHCPDTCPLQTAHMARLQKDFSSEKDFRLVSVTVDPERDTPEVLKEYANRFRADPERWLFLTGKKGAIHELAQKGFRLSVKEVEEKPGPTSQADPSRGVSQNGKPFRPSRGNSTLSPKGFWKTILSAFAPVSAWAHHPEPLKPFIHSSRFALVDRKAVIRSYYHFDDPKALARLRRNIRKLLEGRP